MKIPRIIQSVGYIDDDLIESAANASISVRRSPIRRLVYVAICAILAIIACVTVYAISGGTDWFVPREGRESPPDDGIPQVKEFVSPEGDEYFLRYDSEITDGNGLPLYTYTDDHGNYYYYNKEGDFVKSLHNDDDHSKLDAIMNGKENFKVSADEAREIAKKYLLAHHGEEFFTKYEFMETSSVDSLYQYYVKYSMFHGKDAFIKGQSTTVSVRYDGVVTAHSVTNPEIFKEFNFDIIEDLSKSDVERFVESILDEVAYLKYNKEELVKGYDKYEIADIRLGVYEDEFCIHIGTYVYAEWVSNSEYITNCYSNWQSDVPMFRVDFRYPLENK